MDTIAPLFFIGSPSILQVTRTGIKFRISSTFGQIRLLTLELLALERLKKCCGHDSAFIFCWFKLYFSCFKYKYTFKKNITYPGSDNKPETCAEVKLAGNKGRHEISEAWVRFPDRSAIIIMEKLCLPPSMLSFYWMFIKLVDNQSRHKISNKFEFVSDQTIYVGLTCPWVPKSKYLSLCQTVCFFLSDHYETCK